MNTTNNTTKNDKQQEQPHNFIEGDNIVPQGGELNKNKQQDKKEKSNPPSTPPQKTEKKIPDLRNNS